jgi:hypothetical protein
MNGEPDPQDEYTLPRGVSLGGNELHEALAALGIAAYSSVTIARGTALTHTFLDRAHGRSVRVVESQRQSVEVVGDSLLWRRVRAAACNLADLGRQRAVSAGEVVELGVAVVEPSLAGRGCA